MNHWIRFFAAGLVLVITACGEFSADSPLAPEAPSLDSSPIVGGNKVETPMTTYEEASDTTTRSSPIVGGN